MCSRKDLSLRCALLQRIMKKCITFFAFCFCLFVLVEALRPSQQSFFSHVGAEPPLPGYEGCQKKFVDSLPTVEQEK